MDCRDDTALLNKPLNHDINEDIRIQKHGTDLKQIRNDSFI